MKWFEELQGPDPLGEITYSDVYFRVASKKNMYSLDPYKILDLLGDLGGLLEYVRAIGMILTASMVKKAFDISLLSETYQVQGYNKDQSEFYKSKKARECFQKQLDKSVHGEAIKLTSSSEEGEEKKKKIGDIINESLDKVTSYMDSEVADLSKGALVHDGSLP